MTTIETDTTRLLRETLADWPGLDVALLFGSLADQTADSGSDLDLAVKMSGTLTPEQKMALIRHLSGVFGRPIDLVDIRRIGQPLLGEIADKGVLVKGTRSDLGDIYFRSIMMQEDFGPFQQRILAGRRKRWLSNG